jgi:cobalamin-dependent methionine synthase I
METRVSSATREVLITDEGPTVLIGERINPSGKKNLAEALKSGDFQVLRTEAVAQVEAGADILDVNVVCPGVDEISLAHKIIERAGSFEIPPEDVIIDCLALTVGADTSAALTTLETIRKVKEQLAVNQTLGASNISYGLPDRNVVNHTFLALAIWSGVTCPTIDVAKVRQAILSIDLILARDRFAQRYIREFRKRHTQKEQQTR